MHLEFTYFVIWVITNLESFHTRFNFLSLIQLRFLSILAIRCDLEIKSTRWLIVSVRVTTLVRIYYVLASVNDMLKFHDNSNDKEKATW